MLFHNWTPPPIMTTKEKLNTYPPLFNERPVTMAWQVFHFVLECPVLKAFKVSVLDFSEDNFHYFIIYTHLLRTLNN